MDPIQCFGLIGNYRCFRYIDSDIFCNVHNNMIKNGKKINIYDNNSKIDELLITNCKCCYDEIKINEMVLCSNASDIYQHIFCFDCVREHVTSALGDKKEIKCMMEICDGKYCDEEMEKILSSEQFSRYIEANIVANVVSFSKVMDNYVMCPLCNCDGVVIDNIDRFNDNELEVKCKWCKKSWCMKCRGIAHVPFKCKKLNNDDIITIRKTIDLIIDDIVIHKCPRCLTKYQKISGCNLMSCPSCKTYSCYACGIEIVSLENESKYDHFGRGNCPLYNGKNDVKKINKEMAELLEVNNDNKKILTSLVREIVSRKYKVPNKYEHLKIRKNKNKCCIQ